MSGYVIGMLLAKNNYAGIVHVQECTQTQSSTSCETPQTLENKL